MLREAVDTSFLLATRQDCIEPTRRGLGRTVARLDTSLTTFFSTNVQMFEYILFNIICYTVFMHKQVI